MHSAKWGTGFILLQLASWQAEAIISNKNLDEKRHDESIEIIANRAYQRNNKLDERPRTIFHIEYKYNRKC